MSATFTKSSARTGPARAGANTSSKTKRWRTDMGATSRVRGGVAPKFHHESTKGRKTRNRQEPGRTRRDVTPCPFAFFVALVLSCFRDGIWEQSWSEGIDRTPAGRRGSAAPIRKGAPGADHFSKQA